MEVLTGGRQVLAGGARTPTPREALRSFVNRLLRLTLLAPDIVEAILEGRQPKRLQLEELTWAMPSGWDVQRKPESLEDRMEKPMTRSTSLSTVRLGDPLGDGLGGRRLFDRSGSRRAAREDR